MRIVRTKHEQALRDAIHQLLADGYDWGLLCGLCLDAMGVLEVIDPERKMPRRRRRQKSEGNSSKFPSDIAGVNPSQVIIDDLIQHQSRELIDALAQAPGRREPLSVRDVCTCRIDAYDVACPEHGPSPRPRGDVAAAGSDAHVLQPAGADCQQTVRSDVTFPLCRCPLGVLVPCGVGVGDLFAARLSPPLGYRIRIYC